MTFKHILPIAVMSLALSASVAAAQRADVAIEPIAVPTVEPAPIGVNAAPRSPLEATAGPRLAWTRAGIAAVRDAAGDALVPVPQPSITRKRGVPQMIIGGAAILGGAIVGGDAGGIVSLAGLGVGLYGLYLYLQ